MTAKKFLDVEEAAEALVLQLRPLKEQLEKQVDATRSLSEARNDLKSFLAEVEQLPPLISDLFKGLDETTLVGIRKEIGSTLSSLLTETRSLDAKVSRQKDVLNETVASFRSSLESATSHAGNQLVEMCSEVTKAVQHGGIEFQRRQDTLVQQIAEVQKVIEASLSRKVAEVEGSFAAIRSQTDRLVAATTELLARTDRLQGAVTTASNEGLVAAERLKMATNSAVSEIERSAQQVGDQVAKRVLASAEALNRKINLVIGLAIVGIASAALLLGLR